MGFVIYRYLKDYIFIAGILLVSVSTYFPIFLNITGIADVKPTIPPIMNT